MHVLSERKYNKDGFTVVVKRVLDEDTSYLERKYEDETASNRAAYRAQDAERLAGLRRGNWHFIGIMVSVKKQTITNWADGGLEVGRASVWGYESDSDESFLKDEEEGITEEAFGEVMNLRAALCG